MSNENDDTDHDDTDHDDTVQDDEIVDAAERAESERAELDAMAADVSDVDIDAQDDAEDDLDSKSFVLLTIALLVLVGGSVFFVGKLLDSKNETAEAQARAEADLADFETQLPDTVPILPFDENEFTADPNATTTTTQAPTTTGVQQTTTTIAQPTVDPSQISLAFVNRVPGDDYAKVGYIDPQGERHITELRCDRLDLNEAGGICLSATAGANGTGRGLVVGPNLNPSTRFGVNKPSRAAVSPDGSIVAWTGFTFGHSYLVEDEFATTTQLISLEKSIGVDLEDGFNAYRDDELVNDLDRNFWGVTFAGDNDLFYATVGTSANGEEIVSGRISTGRLDVVATNASCPEVSPDGRTIVAKEQRGDKFQLISIDVETGARRDLAEARSIDDQVEWIDNETILYGVANPDEGTDAQPVLDIYALKITTGEAPRLIVPFADSPAA